MWKSFSWQDAYTIVEFSLCVDNRFANFKKRIWKKKSYLEFVKGTESQYSLFGLLSPVYT
jgi:hypothetical protein